MHEFIPKKTKNNKKSFTHLKKNNPKQLSGSRHALSVVGPEAVDTVQLVLLVGEADEAHGGLAGAAALAGPRDGVAHAAVRQPARVAAVVAQQLPGREDLPHLGDLGAVLQARLHGLVVGQLGGVDQVVEATWKDRGKMEPLAA